MVTAISETLGFMPQDVLKEYEAKVSQVISNENRDMYVSACMAVELASLRNENKRLKESVS